MIITYSKHDILLLAFAYFMFACSLGLDLEYQGEENGRMNHDIMLDQFINDRDMTTGVRDLSFIIDMNMEEIPKYDEIECDEACEVEWVSITGGLFSMGSDTGDDDETPITLITLQPFEVSKSEVTVGQYSRCVQAGVCPQPVDLRESVAEPITEDMSVLNDMMPPMDENHDASNSDMHTCNWFLANRRDHPMNCITQCEAQIFAEWLDVRLLSEAEWEGLAQRLDIKNECDSTFTQDCLTDIHDEYTQQVCLNHQNTDTSYTTCDLFGNLAEWVSDLYHSDYLGRPGTSAPWERINIVECEQNLTGIVRGGSWRTMRMDLSSSDRTMVLTQTRKDSIGFRVAK